MNIINQDNMYMVFGNGIGVNSKLPAATYKVCFARNQGFFLEKRDDFEIKDEKIYGNPYKRVEKIFRAFENSDRNLGVICSGNKGSGKTLLAKLASARAIEKGIPVITVEESIHGISDFIVSIDQECIIIFDEFDKVFFEGGADGIKEGLQDELLTLFDGIANGKKIFFLTCNDIRKLNDCFLGRPGRFHYHFQYDKLSNAEIEEYLNSEIKIDMDEKERKRLSLNCSLSTMSYDVLRAICSEINLGYDLDEIFEDLNIDRFNNSFYLDIYRKGELVCSINDFTPFSQNNNWGTFSYDGRVIQVRVFSNEDAIDFVNGEPAFNKEKIKVFVDVDDYPFVTGAKEGCYEIDLAKECEFGIRERAAVRRLAV